MTKESNSATTPRLVNGVHGPVQGTPPIIAGLYVLRVTLKGTLLGTMWPNRKQLTSRGNRMLRLNPRNQTWQISVKPSGLPKNSRQVGPQVVRSPYWTP
jgi:hypothetical protein